ncbi:MAG: 2-C-methyl-D-erythritol 4-phosphate cytidylyltransferase, partial [Planctomycetota bacterium]
MKLAVIIPAAGTSSRYEEAGGVRHKLDDDLGDRPVLHRAIELFTKRDEVASIVVAGPSDDTAFDE